MFLLRRLLGVKSDDKKQTKVAKLAKGELLLINIGSTSTGGRVLSVKADLAKIQLTTPACTEIGEKVALSRRIEKHWRLVGMYSLVNVRTPRLMSGAQGGVPFNGERYWSLTNADTHCTHSHTSLSYCDAVSDIRVAIEAVSMRMSLLHWSCPSDRRHNDGIW